VTPVPQASLNDLESLAWLERPISRIVYEGKAREADGQLVGAVYAEDADGRRVASFGRLTWKDAEYMAANLGARLDEA